MTSNHRCQSDLDRGSKLAFHRRSHILTCMSDITILASKVHVPQYNEKIAATAKELTVSKEYIDGGGIVIGH